MMNQDQDVESVLQDAPQPLPPSGLKEQLMAQGRSESRRNESSAMHRTQGWFGRWWPILLPGVASAACAMVIAFQRMEIQDLKQLVGTLAQAAASIPAPAAAETSSGPGTAKAVEPIISPEEELARLTDKVLKLRGEVARLQRLQQENAQLRGQLAAPGLSLTADEAAELEKAREKAQSIQCINNLKQLGLAARVWGLDNAGTNPPTVLSMTNEMGTLKILVCPADSGRQPASDPGSYTPANCSYEYLAPSASDSDPQRVMWRCPVHGHVCLVDGSVHSEAFKKHAEDFVTRDGKLYYEPQPADGAPGGAGTVNRSGQ